MTGARGFAGVSNDGPGGHRPAADGAPGARVSAPAPADGEVGADPATTSTGSGGRAAAGLSVSCRALSPRFSCPRAGVLRATGYRVNGEAMGHDPALPRYPASMNASRR
ncbi:hypothetical protein GCM10022416_44280 [Actinomadura keratinilytica]|uniref:Uncharacterized protein n=1 Tax=Actinomadura keratinilytica TaxID=547461 RepID=A0ABP7ZAY9_9ACTN